MNAAKNANALEKDELLLNLEGKGKTMTQYTKTMPQWVKDSV